MTDQPTSTSTAAAASAGGIPPWRANYCPDVNFDAEIPAKPLYALIDEAAQRFGDRPAMDFMDKKVTYAETLAMVNRVAAGLQAMGVKKGSRVGMFLPNCPYFVYFYFGVLKAGGTVVNFNPLYTQPEVEKQIADSGTDIMVTLDLKALYDKLAVIQEAGKLKTIIVCPMSAVLPFPKNLLFPLVKRKEVATLRPGAGTVRFRDVVSHGQQPAPVEIDPKRDIAVLQYTGGTTGIPKGAMLSHYNCFANAVQARLWFAPAREGEEKMLAVLPFFHVFAMTALMNLGIRVGAEIVMMPRFELDPTMAAVTKKKVTVIGAVPTIFSAMANHKDLAKYDLTSVRLCISGGAPLPLEVKAKFEKVTGCVLVEGYGLTESSPVAFCNPLTGKVKAGAIGLPVPQTYFELRSLDDPTVKVTDGEKGELCLKGPQVMLGYWMRPDETARVLMPDGFLRTGDVGFMDEDGYVHLVDRIKDVVICGGYNVYPRVVEEAIYEHPEVLEVTVIGIPDEYRGETVKAFVVRRPGSTLTPEMLGQFLSSRLSPIELPKQIEFRDSLPKSMIGKLSKKELVAEEKARFEAQMAARKGGSPAEQAQVGQKQAG